MDRFSPTTKVCSVCGYVNEALSPKSRRWICPSCKTEHGRGVNAAINIKVRGLEQFRDTGAAPAS